MSTFPPDFLPRMRQIVLPYVTTEDEREALLTDAFYLLSDSRLYHSIKRSGSPVSFTTLLFRTLADYGCLTEGPHALAQLLQTTRFYSGPDKHSEIDALTALASDQCVQLDEQAESLREPVETSADGKGQRAEMERLQRERMKADKQHQRGDLPDVAYEALIARIDTQIDVIQSMLVRTSKADTSGPVVSTGSADDNLGASVFLSYSHSDRAYAVHLQSALQAAGYAVWIDDSKLKGGDDWIAAISAGIRRSFAVVAVVSRASLASRWARTEILKAINEDKLIVPVVVEDVIKHDGFLPLISYQAVRAFEMGRDESVRRVLAAMPRPSLPQPHVELDEIDDEAMTATQEALVATPERTVPRRVELDYLDRLKTEELLHTDRYVEMAGASERARAAEMRTVFELVSVNEVGREEAERRTFENAVDEIIDRRRCVLLGDPGGGKTTTVWRLADHLSGRAQSDRDAPLPILIRLGKWTDPDQSLEDFITTQTGELGNYLDVLLVENRAALLLDGLNEIPAGQHKVKYPQVGEFVQNHPDALAVISCRELDYTLDLGFDKITITPLDPIRIREFAVNYLGEEPGEALFWRLAGENAANQHQRFVKNVGEQLDNPETTFWMSKQLPKDVYWGINFGDQEDDNRYWERWLEERERPSSLMVLARNPYMMSMLASVYAGEGDLPDNRGELFRSFVETLLVREGIGERVNGKFVSDEEGEALLGNLADLAGEMQIDITDRARQQGEDTMVDAVVAVPREIVLKFMTERELYLAGSTNILTVGEQVRFSHQLLQEYFAARRLQYLMQGTAHKGMPPMPAAKIWDPENWWERTNWEESVILLAGLYSDDPTPVVEWLMHVQPEVAAQCINRSGAMPPPDQTLLKLREAWIPRLTDLERDPDPRARAAVGRALGQLTLSNGEPLDNRKGVSVIVRDSLRLPDIDWIEIPGGKFKYGAEDQIDNPPGELELPTFHMSRYPVTYAQFQCFADGPDYNDERWWADMPDEEEAYGLTYRTRELSQQRFHYGNHPRENVPWYQAVAFTRWLSDKLNADIRLPTEQQYERAARGTDGREYPWGDGYREGYSNINETRGDAGSFYLGQTSSVGTYPQGASPNGVLDLSGNVFTWCLNKYDGPDEMAIDDSGAHRALRGGSWFNNRFSARAASRNANHPLDRNFGDLGLVLVMVGAPKG